MITAKQNNRLQQLYVYKNYSFNANLRIHDTIQEMTTWEKFAKLLNSANCQIENSASNKTAKVAKCFSMKAADICIELLK